MKKKKKHTNKKIKDGKNKCKGVRSKGQKKVKSKEKKELKMKKINDSYSGR